MSSEYPEKFKQFIFKLVNVILKIQPNNISECLATFLEAELDKRSFLELTDGEMNTLCLKTFDQYCIDWTGRTKNNYFNQDNSSKSFSSFVRYTINIAANETNDSNSDQADPADINTISLDRNVLFLSPIERASLGNMLSGETFDSYSGLFEFAPRQSSLVNSNDSDDSIDISKSICEPKNILNPINVEQKSDSENESSYTTPREEIEDIKIALVYDKNNNTEQFFYINFYNSLTKVLQEKHNLAINIQQMEMLPIMIKLYYPSETTLITSIKPSMLKIINQCNKVSRENILILNHVNEVAQKDSMARGDHIKSHLISNIENILHFTDAYNVHLKVMKSNDKITTHLSIPGRVSDVVFPGYPIITTDIIINPYLIGEDSAEGILNFNSPLIVSLANSIVKNAISLATFLVSK